MSFIRIQIYSLIFLCCLASCKQENQGENLPHILFSGEVSQHSIILQSRLVQEDSLAIALSDDVHGRKGLGKFELSTDPDFNKIYMETPLTIAEADNDFMIKSKVKGLSANTRYFYRLVSGASENTLVAGQSGTFRTLPEPTASDNVSFVVFSCMNFEKFYGIGRGGQGGKGPIVEEAAEGEERALGFEAFETMTILDPLFAVGTGDNVYYDSPSEQPEKRAKNTAELRAKWHRQFSMPRIQMALEQIPFYWEKDDHDYRFNDADTTDAKYSIPTHETGMAIFREQVPVTDPDDPQAVTYRTYRVNKDVQIWLTEGRDFRSPNDMPDGPEKTLWGKTQKDWLKKTLLESDATFKLLISPTPMVGPDDAYKTDNHTNFGGFRQERDEFFEFIIQNGMKENFIIINGDRHWQYHSISSEGIHEFGTGALVDHNARKGRAPGDPKSTDPEGLIEQPYIQMEPTGGFVQVEVGNDEDGPALAVSVLDEKGDLLHQQVFK